MIHEHSAENKYSRSYSNLKISILNINVGNISLVLKVAIVSPSEISKFLGKI